MPPSKTPSGDLKPARTKARKPAAEPTAAELRRLKISPEVAWYLRERGIPLPDCVPRFKTPEPRRASGVLFDPERVDKVINSMLRMRHTKGRLAGQPLRPDPWQVAYVIAPVFGWVHKNEYGDWVRVVRTLYVELPRKNGKGLSTECPVLTTRGWRTMGDLLPGDKVYAPDGTPTRVRFVSPVHSLPCYRVTFSDGQSLIADEEHLWQLYDRYRAREVVVDTKTMAGNYLIGNRETHRERRYSLRAPAPVQRRKVDLRLDPYLLGLWLGDGTTGEASIATPDEEVLEAFRAGGYEVRDRTQEWLYGLGGLSAELREAGVLHDKHIPELYSLASEKQRLALLQGLMDSDGTVGRGPRASSARCEFTTVRRQFADTVLFLVRSLGWKATLREGEAKLNGRVTGPKFTVSWCAYADEAPFRLQRHIDKLQPRPARPARSSTIQVTSVEPVDSVPTVCIQVEHPSQMYLAGAGLIPTHNTTLAGGIALYLTGADGESGAEVYAAAAGKDQAGFCFEPVKALAEGAPQLKQHFRTVVGKVIHPRTASYFRVVSAMADLMHGANIHGAVVDELHIHKSRDLVDALETGTGARQQPLIMFITTADDSRQGTIYAEKRGHIERLSRRTITDHSTFGVVWAADDNDRHGEKPFLEATWRKANPGYGISPTREFMTAEAKKAKQSPANLARFLRLHLGIRTKQATKYLDLGVWDRNAGMVNENELVGRRCFGGLDLAATSDLTALCWLFPDTASGYDVIWRHWMPEAGLEKLNERTAGEAEVWVRHGWLAVTPGETVNYEYIRKQVNEDRERFQVDQLGYDPWNATQAVTNMEEDGAPMVMVRQGYAHMSPPTKELLRVLLAGTEQDPAFRHGGNPIVRWQVDNLAVQMDPGGNVKPDKAKSGDKIDGLVAAIVGLGRAVEAGPDYDVLDSIPGEGLCVITGQPCWMLRASCSSPPEERPQRCLTLAGQLSQSAVSSS